MKTLIFALALTVASTGLTRAETRLSVDGLVTICLSEKLAYERGESRFDEMFCHGFIQGVYDVFKTANPELCLREGVNRHDIRDAFLDAAHAINDRSQPAFQPLLLIMTEFFPCE